LAFQSQFLAGALRRAAHPAGGGVRVVPIRAGTKRLQPIIQLGQTSLLVYWVHIEFVYGRFSILPKRGVSIPSATLGLLTIFLAMLGLSLLRTRYKKQTIRASRAPDPAPVAPAI
jgi:hypothetical protein